VSRFVFFHVIQRAFQPDDATPSLPARLKTVIFEITEVRSVAPYDARVR